MATVQVEVPERHDPRLGRILVHDPRSRDFPVLASAKYPTKPTRCVEHLPILNQLAIGCCTTNAGLGMVYTDPFYRPRSPWQTFRTAAAAEKLAVQLYSEETQVDDSEIPGHYPPTDSGSSGLWLMKTLQAHGYISGYRWAFGLAQTLAALATSPVCIGVNWYSTMLDADASGMVRIARGAYVAGGHEVVLVAQDPAARWVEFRQSWGTSWGIKGRGRMSWDTLGRLLSEGGDAVTGVPVTSP
jgi:hypothetical protein